MSAAKNACTAKGDDGGECNCHDLQEVHEKDEAAFRAQRFERGDFLTLAIEEGADRLACADAADRQRRQAHQRQEHRDLFDEAANARHGIVVVADFPAAIGKGALRIIPEAIDGCALRERQTIGIFDEAADGHKSGARQTVLRHENMRTEAEAAGDAVGLARQDCRYAVIRRADTERPADGQMQTIEQRLLDDDTAIRRIA
jgi:hypothetical protein